MQTGDRELKLTVWDLIKYSK